MLENNLVFGKQPLNVNYHGKKFHGTYKPLNGSITNVAIKIIEHDNGQNQQSKINDKVEALKDIKCPSVLPIKAYIHYYDNESYIVEDFAPRGSLADLIYKDRIDRHSLSLSHEQKLIIILGVAEGMRYLHSRNIIHRNLRPSNILFFNNYEPHISGYLEFTRNKDYEDYFQQKSNQFNDLQSLSYLAPELLLIHIHLHLKILNQMYIHLDYF